MMDKLKGIKARDRVRVTFEGEVELCCNGVVNVKVDAGDPLSSSFAAADTRSPHFHIERIEKPLGVGDRVKDIAFGFGEGEILAVDGRNAFVRWDAKTYEATSIYLSNLERVS